MRAGELRHPIRIEAPVSEQNSYGEPLITWHSYCTAYAKREDVSGSEPFQSGQHRGQVQARFTIRYRNDIGSEMRINDAGVIYNIDSVQDPEGRMRVLHIYATRATDTPNAKQQWPQATRIKLL